jgi:hypothetical protein
MTYLLIRHKVANSDPVGRTLNNKPVSSVMRFFSPHRPNTPASA